MIIKAIQMNEKHILKISPLQCRLKASQTDFFGKGVSKIWHQNQEGSLTSIYGCGESLPFVLSWSMRQVCLGGGGGAAQSTR